MARFFRIEQQYYESKRSVEPFVLSSPTQSKSVPTVALLPSPDPPTNRVCKPGHTKLGLSSKRDVILNQGSQSPLHVLLGGQVTEKTTYDSKVNSPWNTTGNQTPPKLFEHRKSPNISASNNYNPFQRKRKEAPDKTCGRTRRETRNEKTQRRMPEFKPKASSSREMLPAEASD
ncbi:hypothetical protein BJ508DRAFT_378713 [Ascobolus immersus RN42]|uniref:Uncharacterized protein n=1 Tax=Ascobolus immersus RN42 TaxID=1160509 RepID=A0A3N4HZ61_ASCIM|nr:hypothetical protein BJ508DRAFT_378713 [Ascobolus immersus RN42]